MEISTIKCLVQTMNLQYKEMTSVKETLDTEKSQSPRLSVIVPVYKVESYLSECIESILAQTFTDFELILVDDGSPDKSGAICDVYAEKDSRIRVFHKKNGGVSSARNVGIDHARGEYICFFDGDDWVDRKMLQMLCDSFANGGCIAICGFVFHVFDRKCVKEKVRTPSSQSQSIYQAYSDLFIEGFINSPCNKLFLRSIIKDGSLKFREELSIGEDTIFVTEYFKFAKKVNIVESALYHVRRGAGESAITRFHSNVFLTDSVFKEVLRRLYSDCNMEDAVLLKERVLKSWFWTVPSELIKRECSISFKKKKEILAKTFLEVERGDLRDVLRTSGVGKMYAFLLLVKSPVLTLIVLNGIGRIHGLICNLR